MASSLLAGNDDYLLPVLNDTPLNYVPAYNVFISNCHTLGARNPCHEIESFITAAVQSENYVVCPSVCLLSLVLTSLYFAFCIISSDSFVPVASYHPTSSVLIHASIIRRRFIVRTISLLVKMLAYMYTVRFMQRTSFNCHASFCVFCICCSLSDFCLCLMAMFLSLSIRQVVHQPILFNCGQCIFPFPASISVDFIVYYTVV